VNKQGYIHASYHVAEMAIFEYYEYSFFSTDISGISGGLIQPTLEVTVYLKLD